MLNHHSVLRSVAWTGLLIAVLLSLLVAAPSHAMPESSRASKVANQLQMEVQRRVQRREQALTALFDAAQRHAADKSRRAERLAALGYAGNVSDLAYVLPVQNYHLSAGFGRSGPLWESTHTGLDFGASSGTDLVAVADGTVTEVALAGPYGIRTILTLEDGTELWYCHQLQPLVVEGQDVVIGERIGLVGSTGNSTGPHLHLEVRPGGAEPIDPADWLTGHGLTP